MIQPDEIATFYQERGDVANLNSLEEANKLKKRFAQGDTLVVMVTTGKLTGTVARVVEIKQKHFDRHDYWLEVEGQRRRWWQKGDTIELVDAHTATVYNEDASFVAAYKDHMNQLIEEGMVICFSRASKVNCGIEMVTATVKRVAQSGVWVLPFKVNNDVQIADEEVCVRKPELAIVVNKALFSNVLMTKLSAT